MSKKTLQRRGLAAVGLLAGLLAGSMAFAQTATSLEALDRSHDNDNPDNQLYYHLQVVNNGTAAISLNQVTVRYWFTDNGDKTPLEFDCDYAQLTCANITHKYVTLASPLPLANMYLELGFTAAAGMLQPGTSTGEIQTRTHHTNFSNFNTTQSYSFISDPSFVYKPSATITVYVNGTLVWGVEPH